jgi:glycerol kinase
MGPLILAIDQGTSNSKALLIDRSGRIIAKASTPVGVSYPQPGWVEQSAEEIWQSVMTVIERCLASVDTPQLAAIGISNQRESVMLWERGTGKPVGPAVTWQCRRSAERLDRLRSPAFEAKVLAVTGLGLDPLFPAAKLGWLLDAYPEARTLAAAGRLCAGSVDSWLLSKLAGGAVHATDFGNASRTQLFDIHRLKWSAELAEAFGVPTSILPTPRPSDSHFGETIGQGALPAGVPIQAVMGDSHAALYGHGIRKPGAVKATYGTGSSLMTLTGAPLGSTSGLSTTIAWQQGKETAYALEGNISVSAQAAAWVASILGLEDAAALTALAATVEDTGGAYFVPALVGLGAPHWQEKARAVFSGMSLGTNRAHLARATLEAIALQVVDVSVAMESDLGTPLDMLSVDGGATMNDLLMQLQADLIGRPLRRGSLAELSAMGVGVMAGIAAGIWTEDEALSLLKTDEQVFTPRLTEPERRQKLAGWAAAIAKATP